MEADAKPIDRLSLFFNAGYLFAIYDEYLGANGPGTNANRNRLINAPRWTLAGGGTWDVPVHIPGSLRLGVDAEWQDFVYSSALNRPQDRVPAQAFVNGTITWTAPDQHWSLQLAGRNLLNSGEPVSSSYTPSTAIYYKNYPDPRTVLGTIQYFY